MSVAGCLPFCRSDILRAVLLNVRVRFTAYPWFLSSCAQSCFFLRKNGHFLLVSKWECSHCVKTSSAGTKAREMVNPAIAMNEIMT